MKEAAADWSICERHEEPLKFFCMDDDTPLCVVCEKFKKHKIHHVVLVEVASEEYKVSGIAELRTRNFTMNYEQPGPCEKGAWLVDPL